MKKSPLPGPSFPDQDDAQKPRPSRFAWYWGQRMDAFNSAIFVFPLFLIYQIGILARGGRGQNGVDYITHSLIELCEQNLHTYLVFLGGMLLSYVALLVVLRQAGHSRAQPFLFLLIESSFYALTMGSLILFVLQKISDFGPHLSLSETMDPADVLVISAGAGLHEEILFRLIGMGGLGWLLSGLTGPKRAWIFALVGSSLLFSLAHHLGPYGEDFRFHAFVYRTLAGVFFALVYHFRGFAAAVWTHALYDIYVLSLPLALGR